MKSVHGDMRQIRFHTIFQTIMRRSQIHSIKNKIKNAILRALVLRIYLLKTQNPGQSAIQIKYRKCKNKELYLKARSLKILLLRGQNREYITIWIKHKLICPLRHKKVKIQPQSILNRKDAFPSQQFNQQRTQSLLIKSIEKKQRQLQFMKDSLEIIVFQQREGLIQSGILSKQSKVLKYLEILMIINPQEKISTYLKYKFLIFVNQHEKLQIQQQQKKIVSSFLLNMICILISKQQLMTLYIKPISALLTHDTQIFSNMDPYVVLKIGNDKKKTRTHKEGGKKPKWNQVFNFRPGQQKTMNLVVMDEDTVTDDVVGSAIVDLKKYLTQPGQHKQYISLSYKNRSAGKIYLSIRYQPDGSSQQSSNFGQGMSQGIGMGQGQWGQSQGMGQGVSGWGQPTQPQPYSQPIQPYSQPQPYQQQPPMNQPGSNSGWGAPQNSGWGVPPQQTNPQMNAQLNQAMLAQNLMGNMGIQQPPPPPQQQQGDVLGLLGNILKNNVNTPPTNNTNPYPSQDPNWGQTNNNQGSGWGPNNNGWGNNNNGSGWGGNGW